MIHIKMIVPINNDPFLRNCRNFNPILFMYDSNDTQCFAMKCLCTLLYLLPILNSGIDKSIKDIDDKIYYQDGGGKEQQTTLNNRVIPLLD